MWLLFRVQSFCDLLQISRVFYECCNKQAKQLFVKQELLQKHCFECDIGNKHSRIQN